MRPITSIGEIRLFIGDKSYFFKPSFAAMDSLGTPEHIVSLFYELHSEFKPNPFYLNDSFRIWERDVSSAAYDVMTSCCEEDITPIIGHMGSKWNSFVPGAMSVIDMIHVARSLIVHGVIGDLPPSKAPKKQEDYTAGFDARDFVSQAVAHLGLSTAEAWNLTMTEFSGAMRAKFGKPDDGKLTLDQVDDDMARLEEINALREARKA